jgi:hypothetical protein
MVNVTIIIDSFAIVSVTIIIAIIIIIAIVTTRHRPCCHHYYRGRHRPFCLPSRSQLQQSTSNVAHGSALAAPPRPPAAPPAEGLQQARGEIGGVLHRYLLPSFFIIGITVITITMRVGAHASSAICRRNKFPFVGNT